MSVDPLTLLNQTGFLAKVSAREPVKSTGGNFEETVEKEINHLNLQDKSEKDVAGLVRHFQVNLMKGLLTEDDEGDQGDLLSSTGLGALMVQRAAARSQMIDKYSAVQKLSLMSEPASERAQIDQLIDRVAEHVALAPELIHSVVKAESDYQPDAVSRVGAQGLMQLMPETAAELGVRDSFDPEQNLRGGSRYLKQLLDKYDGDLDHALAAYNWGQGNVDRRGLEQMPDETRQYIARIRQSLSGSSS